MNQDLIKFIKEARKRGFDDYEIRSPLVKQGWADSEIEAAFSYIDTVREKKEGSKTTIAVHLDETVLKIIEKRAKKNLLTIEEQAEDILRRSAVSFKQQKAIGNEKIDDLLVTIFSRKNTGRKQTI